MNTYEDRVYGGGTKAVKSLRKLGNRYDRVARRAGWSWARSDRDALREATARREMVFAALGWEV